MSKPSAFHSLVFARPFEPLAAEEARDRGYLSHVMVKTMSGEHFAVTFYDAVRLAQDLDENARQGNGFVADPGMIVVTEVTPQAMEMAVRALCEQGYFAHLKPLSEVQLSSAADTLSWPPI